MGISEQAMSARNETGVITTKLEELIKWGRKNSLWPLPFGTACCAIEFMGTVSSPFDISRFGAELVRFSPRQSDIILVAGTINYKLAPVLKRIYDQICEPKYVISMGACACSGGFYDNYATVQGIDQIIPVDVFIPGCPPRPDAVLNGLLKLQERIDVERAPRRGQERRPSITDKMADRPFPAADGNQE
jgi:NADH-quinone oxidoreductase subunit B